MPGQPLKLTSAGYAAAFTNFNAIFQQALQSDGYPSVWDQICTVVNSNSDSEQYDFSYFLGNMKKWVGSRQLEKFATETMRVKHLKYENSVEINVDDIADDKTNGFILGLRNLATDAKQHKDDELAGFFNAHIVGTATADYPAGFDGLELFKATHGWSGGAAYTTAQDNILSGSNTGKLDLTYGRDNLQTALDTLKGFRAPNGKRIPARATHLVCSTSTVWAAREICEDAGYQIGGTTVIRGDKNPIAQFGIKVLELPGLTTGYWALLDCSQALKPVIFQLREDINFSQATDGDVAFLTDTLMYGVKARYAFAAGPWWRCVAGDGT